MEALLKPVLALLPARRSRPANAAAPPTGAAASTHHLLYALRDLHPRFVAVASDVRVVPWPHGATDRPDIDSHIPEDLLRRPKLDEDLTTSPAEEYKQLAGAVGGDTAAAADGAAVDDKEKENERKAKEKERKKKLKEHRARPTWGCCLTDRGTITFVDPDGLTLVDATVSRRDMERIEVRGSRHAVDGGTTAGGHVTIVWTLPPNDLQQAATAKERFKEVAGSVLPDVEYIDVTPDSDDDEDDEHDEEHEEEEEEEQLAEAVVEDADLVAAGDAPPAEDDERLYQDDDEAVVDDDVSKELPAAVEEMEEEPDNEESFSSLSTEYEEAEEDPDEDPVDLADVVNQLKAAKVVAADANRRRLAAQRWLAEHPAPSLDDDSTATSLPLDINAGGASSSATDKQLAGTLGGVGGVALAGSLSGTAAASPSSSSLPPPPRTARERGLRLALLVTMICDKQRALAVASSAGPVGARRRR